MARRRAPRRLWLLVPAALAAAMAVLVVRAERKLSHLALGGLGESFSTRVYAAPFTVDALTAETPQRLAERLRRLGYREVPKPSGPGEYAWEDPELRVWLRGFERPEPAQPGGLFVLTHDEGRWSAEDAAGAQAPLLRLEPELAAELSGEKKVRREPAALDELPERLRQAVVAVEDKRFYRHLGLDPRAILRSTWYNAVEAQRLQGGSTITQQLVKNLFLSPQRTLRRKLAEAALAFYLELRFSKERILEIYLNHIYLGQDGATAVAGMKAAARFYFGKEPRELDLPECALLAGIIRSPFRYNPRRDPAEAKARRDWVLKRMREEGYVTRAEAARASAAPVKVTALPPPAERRDNDYFVAEVVRQALPQYGEETLYRHGLTLYTTLDPLLQRSAQRAVRKARSQAALVALDPATGRVLALVGGKNFGQSQYNRATQARRQPGSAFKPFVVGAALEAGMTPATMLEDAPKQYQQWKPRNYDGVYLGTASVRQALALSLNAATLDLANKVGAGAVAEYARRMGVESPLEETLGLALGSSEVGLLELTAAYAPFANGGFRAPPHLISAVYDAAGELLAYTRFERETVLDPPHAFLMISLLESVVREGTARALALHGFTAPAAGKTGTTNDGRDAWFVGCTPRLLAGVWVGDDAQKKLNATGAKDALPIWAAFMKESVALPSPEFEKPEGGLVSVEVDPLSGFLAIAGCPTRQRELFIAGTEPTSDCPLHPSGVRGWFQRWFGR